MEIQRDVKNCHIGGESVSKKRMTAQQMEIIGRLAQGMKRQEVAADVGCDVQTVDRLKAAMKKDPALKEAYYKLCGDEIESLVPLAIKRLRGIIENDVQHGSVHVAAVREVLNRSYLQELLDATQKEIRIEIVYE